MPLYDEDLEQKSGVPDSAKKLKKIMVDHDALFIASPEYNGSFSGVLKNTIDWLSRPHEENEISLSAFNEKIAAISSASPGGLGGLRGLTPLRLLLSNINVTVISSQYALSKAYESFDDDGNLKDPSQKKSLENIVKSLVKLMPQE
jgi:NAD(P)H-dependent FMN reductase